MVDETALLRQRTWVDTGFVRRLGRHVLGRPVPAPAPDLPEAVNG